MRSKVRAANVRSFVRAWRPFWAWWSTSGNKQCGHSTSVKGKQMPVMAKQADALEATLTGTERGQAWQTHSTYLAAAELLVMNQEQPPVLRCYAFWRCSEAWAALRFSGHRGLSPASCGLNETSFRGTLSRTQTTGKDKKVQNSVLHVSRNCWLLNHGWMKIGWQLRQATAP